MNKEMYIQTSLFDGTEQSKEEQAIKLIYTFSNIAIKRNPLGYVVGYSGGKDSDVLVNLFIKAKERYGDKIKFTVIHNHTGLDAPETVYYIRKRFAEWRKIGIDCRIYLPKKNIEQLCIEKKLLPTRFLRFCCAELKERNDIEELKYAVRSFGVRKSESVKRAMHRNSIETRDTEGYGTKSDQRFHFDDAEEVANTSTCYTNKYFIVNPIAYWTEEDVWSYIKTNKLEYNPLYDQGVKRVGCIGCPMAGKRRMEEFKKYPAVEKRYKKIIHKLVDNGFAFKSYEENKGNIEEQIFNWWVGND